MTASQTLWLTRLAVAATVSVLLLIASLHAQEDQEQTLTLELRPHCEEGYDADTWIYGSDPAEGWTIDPEDPERCADFPVRDPQSRETPLLAPGDVLDLDLVVVNPEEIAIGTVGAWLEYDTNVLQGLAPIEIYTDVFPEVTPGEADFNAAQGQVRLEVSVSPEDAPSGYWVPVARIRFTVQETSVAITPITFFDDQPEGKTHVVTTEQSDEGHEVDLPLLGTLMVRVAADGSVTGSGAGLPADSSCTTDTQCASNLCHLATCQPENFRLADGSSCRKDEQCASAVCDSGFCAVFVEEDIFDDDDFNVDGEVGALCSYSSECISGICYEGQCQAAGFLIPDGGACQDGDQCASGSCQNETCGPSGYTSAASSSAPSSLPPPVLPNGSSCTGHGQCGSGYCANGFCAEMTTTAPLGITGAVCTQHEQCQSQLCLQGVCQPVGETPESAHTAFGLLQIRNVRVTTAGDAAFLAWDPLQSSRLKAYNVYYGTAAGQYIQRKTIPGNTDSIALRGLPEGSQYFFAVKAVSLSDEESAFSQEVSVVIGDPTTSSAPLALSAIEAAMGGNPVQTGTTVPGKTGPSSLLVILGLLSAGIGTSLAARRQTLLR